MRIRRSVSLFLSFAVIMTALCGLFGAVSHAEEYDIAGDKSEADVIASIEELFALDGMFFTSDGVSCGCDGYWGSTCDNAAVFASDWFTAMFGECDTDRIPGHYYTDGTYLMPRAWTCAGFANFAMWYVFRPTGFEGNGYTVTSRLVCCNTYFNEYNLRYYLKPGDIIRVNGHSCMFYGFTDSGIVVLDCNWGLDEDWSHGRKINYSRIHVHTIDYSNYIVSGRLMAITRAEYYGTTDEGRDTDLNDAPSLFGTETDEYRMISYLDGLNLRIRTGPGTEYGTVGLVPEGEILHITRLHNGWGYTEYTGIGGWICLDGYTEPADSGTGGDNTDPPATTDTQETEPPAPETTAPETEPPAPETTAPETEPPAPETTAPDTDPPAPETTAPVTDPPAPETTGPEEEPPKPPAPPGPAGDPPAPPATDVPPVHGDDPAPVHENDAPTEGSLDNFVPVAEYDDRFADVGQSDWFYENVSAAYSLGLMKGDSDTSFNSKGYVTVAEAVTMACRLHSIYRTGKEDFQNGEEIWYLPYIEYALDNGILLIDFDALERPITRSEFAAVFSAAMPDEALYATNDIPDGWIPDVSGDPNAADIYRLYRAGILTGNDELGTFMPHSSILRVEAAAIVTRMADASLRKTITLQ